MDGNYFTPFGARAPIILEIPASRNNPWTYRSVAIAWGVSMIIAVLLLCNLARETWQATATLDRQYAMADRV